RNVVWRWFTDPDARVAYAPEEHDQQARLHVADLRAAVGRRGGKDAEAARLVARLKEASGEFVRLWELHEVGVLRGNRMRVRHPSAGEIELDCEVLVSPEADQRLFVFTAPAGSPSVRALDRLRTAATAG
ncbi:MAG TPA: transcriptional regulator, partial [Phytomonospora sp.]